MAEAGGIQGKVFQGTCGWSDSSIVKCGRFYPASVKSTEDRLLHYSRLFPCVECDSSNYAIPSPTTVEKWVKSVPAGFRFHFKAFGFFTRKSISMSALPHVVRDELPTSAVTRQLSITWEEMSEQLKQKLWDRFNSALLPAYQKNKLGVVIFQFHLAFHSTDENKKHILECRKFLDVRYSMAVEFRSRVWLTDQNLPKTLIWLKEHNIGLVVADELQNELYFDKNNKTADGKGEGSSRGGVVPIVMALGTRDFAYIRVHRRVGKHRILDDDEIKSWGERLRSPEIQSAVQGPIYFMWGTDHEDQPIVNSKHLSKEIGTLAYDWKSKISNTGLLRFCSKVSEERRVTERSASTDEKSKQADKVNTASGQDSKDSRTETTVSPLRSEGLDTRTNEGDYFGSPTSQNSDVGRSVGACMGQRKGAKSFLVGSTNKRSSSSALISPKKKKTSFTKEKSSTSGGQKTIAHFFKK